MSNDALNWAWEALTKTSTQTLILVCLADHADSSGLCWPSLDRITSRTRLNVSTVARNLRQLEQLKLIERERTSGGAGRSTRYRLAMAEPLQTATVAERNLCRAPEKPLQNARRSLAQCKTNHKEPSMKPHARVRARNTSGGCKTLRDQIAETRDPNRLARLCRQAGIGDPPPGMSTDEARRWAIAKVDRRTLQ